MIDIEEIEDLHEKIIKEKDEMIEMLKDKLCELETLLKDIEWDAYKLYQKTYLLEKRNYRGSK